MCGTAVLAGIMGAGTLMSASGQFRAADAYEAQGKYLSNLYTAQSTAQSNLVKQQAETISAIYSAQGDLYKQQAEIQSGIMNFNASMAEWEAGSYERIGQINQVAAEADALAIERATLRTVRGFRREFGKFQKTQVASYAAAGFAPGPGLVTVLDESAEIFEEDLSAIMEEGELSATKTRLSGKAAGIEAGILSMQSLARSMVDKLTSSQIKLGGDFQSRLAKYQGETTLSMADYEADVIKVLGNYQAQGAILTGGINADAARVGALTTLLGGAGNIGALYKKG